VKGNGKRTLYTFEDRTALLQEAAGGTRKLNNVTIYTSCADRFSADSVEKSRRMCARTAASMDELMTKARCRMAPRPAIRDRKSIQLAQRFGVRGTPAIYLAMASRSAVSFPDRSSRR